METVSERARRTGKTVGAIYQQLRSGRIPGALKIDGLWRIPVGARSKHSSRARKSADSSLRDSECHPVQGPDTTLNSSNSGEQVLNELGGPVELPRHPLLERLDYARKLLHDLGLPVTKSNITLVAEAIVAESKSQGLTTAKAYELLREEALADREVAVDPSLTGGAADESRK